MGPLDRPHRPPCSADARQREQSANLSGLSPKSGVLIDACIPYDVKLKGKFPPVVDVSPELRAKIREKFRQIRFPSS